MNGAWAAGEESVPTAGVVDMATGQTSAVAELVDQRNGPVPFSAGNQAVPSLSNAPEVNTQTMHNLHRHHNCPSVSRIRKLDNAYEIKGPCH